MFSIFHFWIEKKWILFATVQFEIQMQIHTHRSGEWCYSNHMLWKIAAFPAGTEAVIDWAAVGFPAAATSNTKLPACCSLGNSIAFAATHCNLPHYASTNCNFPLQSRLSPKASTQSLQLVIDCSSDCNLRLQLPPRVHNAILCC